MDVLPADGLIPNSERYILGPVSLERFEPGIAAIGRGVSSRSRGLSSASIRRHKGNLTLAIFNYPTPNMARERYQEFEKIPGAMVKRAGPLVAVTIEPPDADAAERVLAQVKYAAKSNVESTCSGQRHGRSGADRPQHFRAARVIILLVPGGRRRLSARSG